MKSFMCFSVNSPHIIYELLSFVSVTKMFIWTLSSSLKKISSSAKAAFSFNNKYKFIYTSESTTYNNERKVLSLLVEILSII